MQLTLIIASVLIGIAIGGENQPRSSLCDKKYQTHYAVLNCTPVFENDPVCPSLYKCPEVEKNITGCLYNGRVYNHLENLDTPDPCQYCHCFKLDDGYSYDCISTGCDDMELDNCYNIYKEGKCCAISQECSYLESEGKEVSKDKEKGVSKDKEKGVSKDKEKGEKFCEYNGRKHHYGERILPEEDRCQTCICNKDWSGIYGKGCSRVDCTLGFQELQKGCLPIYEEDKCCPIEYYCKKPEDELLNTTKPLATQEDIQSGKSCQFNGLHYKIGQALNIKYSKYGKNPCATCTCHIPPIFTCIHKEESCI